MRAACTPFGMAISHGTLTIITNAVQQYVIRRWGHQMGVFVDDLILIVGFVAVLAHALCAGYLGGCPICVAAFPAAQQSQTAFEFLLNPSRPPAPGAVREAIAHGSARRISGHSH